MNWIEWKSWSGPSKGLRLRRSSMKSSIRIGCTTTAIVCGPRLDFPVKCLQQFVWVATTQLWHVQALELFHSTPTTVTRLTGGHCTRAKIPPPDFSGSRRLWKKRNKLGKRQVVTTKFLMDLFIYILLKDGPLWIRFTLSLISRLATKTVGQFIAESLKKL